MAKPKFFLGDGFEQRSRQNPRQQSAKVEGKPRFGGADRGGPRSAQPPIRHGGNNSMKDKVAEKDRLASGRPAGNPRKRPAPADDEHYRRALKRMEMGPSDEDDDGGEEDMSGSEDEGSEDDGPAGHQLGYQLNGHSKHATAGRQQDAAARQQPGKTAPPAGSDSGSDEDEDGEPSESEGGSDDEEAPSEQGVGGSDAEDSQDPGGDDSGGGGDDGDDGGGSEDEGDEEEEEERLRQLQELPLGMRVALNSSGLGPQGEAAKAAAKAARAAEVNFKRANKHRPQEMSSKRPVPRLREVLPPIRKQGKDPRFEPMRSESEKNAAARRYAFLYDDVLAGERAQLKQAVTSESNPRAKAALAAQLQRVEGKLQREESRRTREQIERSVKAKQREAVAAGKSPYFLKQSEKKKLELVAKYEALKSKGQLDKFMERRRKKNASKDHRFLPADRRAE